jgi:hypothetical protein
LTSTQQGKRRAEVLGLGHQLVVAQVLQAPDPVL